MVKNMSYKMKKHSGAQKRFSKTASGKIKFSRAGKRHLLTKKTRTSKRHKRNDGFIGKCDINHIKYII